MRYVAAALLVSMAGNELTKANIQRILESVGVECEDDKLQIVLDQLKGKVIVKFFWIRICLEQMRIHSKLKRIRNIG